MKEVHILKMFSRKCAHLHVNAKMIPAETTPGIWGAGDKGE
jgi:hypothetical protein